MEIRLTRDEDIEALKRLFKEVFDEEGTYTEYFFKYYYDKTVGVAAFEGEKLLSALYLLPCKFKSKGKEYSFSYVFAVATFLSERGKGYSSRVINFAHEYLKEQGADGAALVPAEKSLFDFYKRFGYKTCLYVKNRTCHVLKSKKLPFKKVDLSSKKALRDDFLNRRSDGFISWGEDALKFCSIDNFLCEGDIISFPSLGEGYAVCYPLKDSLWVKEIVCKESVKRRFINALGNHYDKSRVIVRDLPVDKSEPFGMAVPLSDRLKEEIKEDGIYAVSLPLD